MSQDIPNRIQPQPYDGLCNLIEKFVPADFQSSAGDHSISEIVYAIYRKDSTFWRRLLGESVPLDDFIVAASQSELFTEAIAYANPRNADEALSAAMTLLVNIAAWVERQTISGYYTDIQAMVIRGNLAMDFSRIMTSQPNLTKCFYKNNAAYRTYVNLFNPYERYMVQKGIWKPSAKSSTRSSTSAPEPTSPDTGGCLGMILLAAGLPAAIFFLMGMVN